MCEIFSYSWMNDKLEVRETIKYGKGVYTKKRIIKDDLLSIFGGTVLTVKEELTLPIQIRDIGVQISENHVLGIRNISELEDASYFNHSCEPNAGFRGQIFLVAMRNIMKGEQITFDYAMAIHRAKGVRRQYSLKCNCEAMECRKIITVDDWKNPELQMKYDGYFQWYLQDKINKNKP